MDTPGVTAGLQRVTTTFKVTVFRSRKTKQVLVLEAGKDFVDTLLSFLVLPMGTIINLLSQGIQVNPFGGIACMLESLDSSFMHLDKNHLLKSPPPVVGCTCQPTAGVVFHQDLVRAEMMHRAKYSLSYSVLYSCSNDCGLYSHNRGARCGVCSIDPSENRHVFRTGPYSGQRLVPTAQANGYVKDNLYFLVTDKLEIIPSSIYTSMSPRRKLELTSVQDTESDDITVTITQIAELLHSALISKTCLSDIFGKK